MVVVFLEIFTKVGLSVELDWARLFVLACFVLICVACPMPEANVLRFLRAHDEYTPRSFV